MIILKKTLVPLILIQLVLCIHSYAQTGGYAFEVTVVNERSEPVDGATVKLLKASAQVKAGITAAGGNVSFNNLAGGSYTLSVTYTGYKPLSTRVYQVNGDTRDTLRLQQANTALQEVNVVAKTPMVQQQRGKTVVNVAASVTNEGATVLEVLEKSPGVMVDKNGGISLQGKPGVLVMIDDKPTYLSGDDLTNLLTSMSSSQVAQIELIPNPTARYDANGNAGIINIKTKKNKTKGFNGSLNTSYGAGHYPKNTNSLILNYRAGKLNTFFNYNINYVKYYMDLFALRKYYDANNQLTSTLNQVSFLPGRNFTNLIKTGFDYSLTPKTTIGMVFTGNLTNKKNSNEARANWLSEAGGIDSSIATHNNGINKFKNGGINLNLRQNISASQDISADFDYLHYNIQSDQNFRNNLLGPAGYEEISRGDIPTTINIGSGKVDYTLKLNKSYDLQAGWKSSFINTDNQATYQNLLSGQWQQDNTKTNHFIYKEKIHALYTTIERKTGKLTGQLGLRYEHTGYDANQLGNATQKDSSFSRNYGQFFPSGYLSLQADSSNTFTITAGRRIDRPPFQNLNPFYFIINKYTYNTGNPFLLPQFSYNLELSHQYRNLLTTTVSYSTIKNYFSQIFLSDPNNDAVLLYTQGNVGRTYNLGASMSLSLSPASWWSVTTQAVFNHKQLRGFNGNSFTTDINQLNLNMNNQFTIAKIYTAELSGFYTTKARNDVQELLYPIGQVSVGIARPVLRKKGTLRLTARDLFHTNGMEGFTTFPNATEYFMLKRDSRVVTLSFTYRFGKTFKTTKRSTGSATDEIDRVGGGG